LRKWGLAIALAVITNRVPLTYGVNATDLPDIHSCISRLDPELDIGYERIAARCPELVKQIEHGAWAPWLPRGWKEPGNDLSAGGLEEFRELVSRERAAAPAGRRAPDVRRLNAILQGLTGKPADSGWSRFKAWLRSILERQEQVPQETWFSRMVSHVGLSQSLRQLVAYLTLGVVVVLAAVIIVNELRAAGVLRGARAAVRRRASMGHLTPEKTWSDIEQSPLLDRPRLLLELIVGRLGERGYLPPAGALTVRELTKAVRLPEPDDRSRLADLAIAAERVRYSARGLQSSVLEGAIHRGRELLDRLNASAPR
jgi:hypothetical protein